MTRKEIINYLEKAGLCVDYAYEQLRYATHNCRLCEITKLTIENGHLYAYLFYSFAVDVLDTTDTFYKA